MEENHSYSLDQYLNEQVEKLGYHLCYIREDALNRILILLNDNFVKLDVLVEKENFLNNLIDWFSYPQVTKKIEVLNLILDVCQAGHSEKVLAVDSRLSKLSLAAISDENDQSLDLPKIFAKIHRLCFGENNEFETLSDNLNINSRVGHLMENSSKFNSLENQCCSNNSGISDQLYLSPNSDGRSWSGGNWALWTKLPAINLIRSDLFVLNALTKSLKEPDQRDQAAYFFTTVLLQDFPPQVFLQKPSIVKVLLNLLNQGSSATDIAIQCLTELTLALYNKISYYSNCNMCSIMSDFYENELENSNSVNENSTFVESDLQPNNRDIVFKRESEAISLPEYCSLILSTLINEDLPSFSSFFKYWRLTVIVTLLFNASLPKISLLWASPSSIASKVRRRILSCVTKFSEILVKFQKKQDIVEYLQILSLIKLILSVCVPLEVSSIVIPENLQTQLMGCLVDPILRILYPQIWQCFLSYIESCKNEDLPPWCASMLDLLLDVRLATCNTLYVEVNRVADSLQSGAAFLLEAQDLNVEEALNIFYSSLEGIEYHQQYEIIKKFIYLSNNVWNLSTDLEQIVIRLTIHLLSYPDLGTRQVTYTELRSLIESKLGPSASISVADDPGRYVSLIVRMEILEEIILFGLQSDDQQIKDNSEVILIMILKSRLLIPKPRWLYFLEQLKPIFPYFSVLCDRSTILGRCILNMADPDIASSLQLSVLQIFCINVRLLYNKRPDCREEALCRLMFLLDLNTQPSTFIEYDDSLTEKKTIRGLYQPESLIRVLELLNSNEPDDKVFIAGLTQISVMTEDLELHKVFVENYGNLIIPYILYNSIENMDENSCEQFSLCLTIMKNILRHQESVRYEFVNDLKFIKFVLKGLFLLDLAKNIRNDAGQLLFFLSFCDIVVTNAEKISLPYFIWKNIKKPIAFDHHCSSSPSKLPSIRETLLKDSRYVQTLSAYWWISANNGLDMLLNNEGTCQLKPPTLLPFPESLLVSFRKSHIIYNITACLEKIQNATSHKHVFEALHLLWKYMPLVYLTKQDINNLKWENTIGKFLLTPPASTTDHQLFLEFLKFLNLNSGSLSKQFVWLERIIIRPSPILKLLLTQITENEETSTLKKECTVELLKLVEICLEKNQSNNWDNIINLIASTLAECHPQRFYSIGLLDVLLRCLLKSNNTVRNKNIFCNLLLSFHCETTHSYMGLTITRLAVLCLNKELNLSKERNGNNKIENYFLDDELKWLPKLLESHDCCLKAETLSLFAGFCQDRLFATQTVANVIENLWELSLNTIVNHNEINLVRETAANLCKNLTFYLADKSFPSKCEEKELYKVVSYAIGHISHLPKLTEEQILCLQQLGSPNSTNSSDIETLYGITTPSFLSASISFILNLLPLNIAKVTANLINQGLARTLFRYMTKWPLLEQLNDPELVNLFIVICKLLCHCCSECGSFKSSCVTTLQWLMNTKIYDVEMKLQSELQREALKLLAYIFYEKGSYEISIDDPSGLFKTICTSIQNCSDKKIQFASLLVIPSTASSFSSENINELVDILINEWERECSRMLRIALGSLLSTSHCATETALKLDLPKKIISRLSESYLTLSITPLITPRNRKSSRILSEVGIDVGLITNLMAASATAKEMCTNYGLADSLHKLLAWCLLDNSLLSDLLRALITLTAQCQIGAQSLVLTSTMTGVGQRKTPSSNSIIHDILNLLNKELYPINIKQRILELIIHACQAPECRVALSKSNLLSEYLKFCNIKKSSNVDQLELTWLKFFIVFTSFTEGQTIVIKNDLVLENIISNLTSNKISLRSESMEILRNLSFYPPARPKLLSSEKLLLELSNRLASDDICLNIKELRDVLLVIWCLTVNNQKGKMVIREYGFLSKIKYLISVISEDSKDVFYILLHVNDILI